MSFGFSVGDLIAASSLLFKVSHQLRDFESPHPQYPNLVADVASLASAYRQIEAIGLDNFAQDEVDVFIAMAAHSSPIVALLLDLLHATAQEPPRPKSARWLWRPGEKRAFPTPMKIEGFVADLHPAVRSLRLMLERVEADRARGEVEQLSDLCDPGVCDPSIYEDPSRHEVYVHHRDLPSLRVDFDCFHTCTTIEPLLWLSPRRPRACVLIIALFFVFVLLSSFLGAFFTVNKQYGYSMGDAFTLAGWVVAVGAFSLMGIAGWHYPRCRCWERGEGRGSEVEFLMQPRG